MRALRLLSLAYFIQATGALSIVGALTSVAKEWSLNNTQSAYLIAVFGITFAVMAPFFQMVIGHIKRRSQLLTGLSIFFLGSLVFSLSTNYPTLLFSRFIMGLGAALMGPVLVALGADMVEGKHQGSAIATVLLGLSLSNLIGIPISSWIAYHLGPRTLFLSISALTFIAAVMTLLWVPQGNNGQRIKGKDILQMLGHLHSLSSLLVVFFLATGVFTTYSFIEPIIHIQYGGSNNDVSTALTILGIAGLIGNFFVVRAAAKMTSTSLLLIGIGLLIIDLILLMIIPSKLYFLYFTLIIWAFATDILWPTQQRRVVELNPVMRGIALALTASFLFCGISLGSTLAGWIFPALGYAGLLVVSIASLLLAVLCIKLSSASDEK